MFKKHKDWIFLNLPAIFLFIFAFLMPDARGLMLSTLGYCALALLIIVLSLNPLISLFPTRVFLKKLNHHRRIIGVAVFTYGFCHAFLYIQKKGWSFFTQWLFHPIIVPAFLALIIFSILAITSNKVSLKKLGFPLWKRIHNKVYIAEALIFIHMLLQGGTTRLVATSVFPPLWMLQYIRRKKRQRKAALKQQADEAVRLSSRAP